MTRFLYSFNETIDNINKNLIKLIIISYSYEERAYETNEENIIIPRIKNLEAL